MMMIYNFAAFQIGWFACVVGGANHWPWAGSAVALVIIAIHLVVVRNRGGEILLIVIAGTLGALCDSLLVAAYITQFPSGIIASNTAPVWIIALWMLFATTLNHSLRWLQGRYLIATLFGLVGGPAAYYAGHRLGGVEFTDPIIALTALALIWATVTPLLLRLSTWISEWSNGGDETAPPVGAACGVDQ